MAPQAPEPLCIERRALIRLLQRRSPADEHVRTELLAWASRAETLTIFAKAGTPLDEIRVGKRSTRLTEWLDSFDDEVRRELGLSDRDVDVRLAERLGIPVKHLNSFLDEEYATVAGSGLTVQIADVCPPP